MNAAIARAARTLAGPTETSERPTMKSALGHGNGGLDSARSAVHRRWKAANGVIDRLSLPGTGRQGLAMPAYAVSSDWRSMRLAGVPTFRGFASSRRKRHTIDSRLFRNELRAGGATIRLADRQLVESSGQVGMIQHGDLLDDDATANKSHYRWEGGATSGLFASEPANIRIRTKSSHSDRIGRCRRAGRSAKKPVRDLSQTRFVETYRKRSARGPDRACGR
jgi:hypothetical protein